MSAIFDPLRPRTEVHPGAHSAPLHLPGERAPHDDARLSGMSGSLPRDGVSSRSDKALGRIADFERELTAGHARIADLERAVAAGELEIQGMVGCEREIERLGEWGEEICSQMVVAKTEGKAVGKRRESRMETEEAGPSGASTEHAFASSVKKKNYFVRISGAFSNLREVLYTVSNQ